ncbi:MAG TPA: mechanosensitive ion channel family protein [Polyangiaceae bacterium]|nr:mechanosensitive ion channel family protein [Polyangiaceae bacterium]
MEFLGSLRMVIPLTIIVLVLAGLVRFVPAAPRRRLRRSVLLYALYLGLTLAHLLIERLGFAPGLRTGLRIAVELCELLLIIELAAIALFDLLLRVVRLNVPDILHDLAVGAAYLVAMVWSMHHWGFDLTSIVATSAVVTAVIGLSLQSTLGNVIGGLALQIDDSIREGDWIELESKAQGQVKRVRWRHTVIETRDWDTLIVPNGQLLNQTIKILGKRNAQPAPHRMWVHFNVDHRYAPAEVIAVVERALAGAPIANVARDPAPSCVCYDLAYPQRDSYCHYALRYFLEDLSCDDPTSSAVRERIFAALKRAQIPLALPASRIFASSDDTKAESKALKQQAELVENLRGVELFSKLSDDELALLARSTRPAPFVQGEVVTRQGAEAHWLYVLVRGDVEVRVATDRGSERRVAVLSAPSFFGEMALMTGAPREATVIALTSLECLRVDKDQFREVLARRPELAQEISTLLAQRRVELETARDNLDAETKNRRVQSERSRILGAIRDFFALEP